MSSTVLPSDPKWLKLAFADLGTLEGPGGANNPKIVGYYIDAGQPGVKQDSVPWCAAFIGAFLKRAGFKPSGSLLARSYLKWGKATKTPKRGDLVVFSRGLSWQGHVAFYLYTKASRIWVLGGNQSNKVSVTSYAASTVLGYRSVEGAAPAEVTVTYANAAAENFSHVAPPYMVMLMQDIPGFTIQDAAAVIGGNFGYETAGFTKLEMPGVIGWPHWRGSRAEAFRAWCAKNGKDPLSHDASYEYVVIELKGSEKGAVAKTIAAVGLEAKTIAFERAYERAGEPRHDQRIGWANRAMKVWEESGKPVPVQCPPTTVTPAVTRDVAIIGSGTAVAATSSGFPWELVVAAGVLCLVVYLLWRYRNGISSFLKKLKPVPSVEKEVQSPDLQKQKAELLKVLETRFDVTGSVTSMTRSELDLLNAAHKEGS